jgi:hypothetical protein
MNIALRACILAAALVALWGCGPKPAPGETDRDHAEDAFGQMK